MNSSHLFAPTILNSLVSCTFQGKAKRLFARELSWWFSHHRLPHRIALIRWSQSCSESASRCLAWLRQAVTRQLIEILTWRSSCPCFSRRIRRFGFESMHFGFIRYESVPGSWSPPSSIPFAKSSRGWTGNSYSLRMQSFGHSFEMEQSIKQDLNSKDASMGSSAWMPLSYQS